MPGDLNKLLEQSQQYHNHLCPRQVLGVRIGLAGVAALGLPIEDSSKLLLVIAETDGCFLSGLMVATGRRTYRRTLRIEDYGKVAATFVDVRTERAVRITPQHDVRQRAWAYAQPGEKRRYFAMLHGYQRMPEQELLHIVPVGLRQPVATIMSRAGGRITCDICGEEIINEREVQRGVERYCISCAFGGYYDPVAPAFACTEIDNL